VNLTKFIASEGHNKFCQTSARQQRALAPQLPRATRSLEFPSVDLCAMCAIVGDSLAVLFCVVNFL